MVPSLIVEKYEKIEQLDMMNSKPGLKINNMGFFIQFMIFTKTPYLTSLWAVQCRLRRQIW